MGNITTMKSSEMTSYRLGKNNNVIILLLAYFMQKVNLRMMDDLYDKLK